MRAPQPMQMPGLKNPFKEAVVQEVVQGTGQKKALEPRKIDKLTEKVHWSNPANSIAQVPPQQAADGLPQEPVKIKKKPGPKPKAKVQVISEPQAQREIQPQLAEWQRKPEWAGKELSILFPCHKHTNPVTAWVLAALALDLGRDSVGFDMEFGDAMVYHSRNKLAENFLASNRPWSLWIDDDMIPPIGRAGWFKKVGGLPDSYPDSFAGKHVVHRMIEHAKAGKTLVGGLYVGRRIDGRPMFEEAHYDIPSYQAAMGFRDEVRPTNWVGTGCMFVHRQVYLDIQAKFPDLAPTKLHPRWNFFRPEQDMGEDVAFCARAKVAGHQPFVDLGLHALHVGHCAWNITNVQNKINR